MALIKRDRENFWILNWLDEYMTGHKGFICGGCFKNIFNKEKVTMDDHPVILKHLDGITVTVHAEATDEDIRNLKYMSSNLYDEDLDMRLFIDKRVYDRYDLSNICMKTWDVVRKLEWKEKCDPAENEELFLWNLY